VAEPLFISEDTKKDFYIKNLSREQVSNLKEVLNVLKRGEESRHYAQTVMNHNSSRSHSIFRLHIKSVTNPMIWSQLKGQLDQ